MPPACAPCRLAPFVVVAAVVGRALLAQCELAPGALAPHLVTDGTVRTTVNWDPDGAGPRTPLLVVGGTFRNAGGIACRNVATLDPATGQWAALGAGMSGDNSSTEGVYSLAVDAQGRLVAGGRLWFQTPGGTVGNVAHWDGSGWQPVGVGTFPMLPNAVLALPNGELVAAGVAPATLGSSARAYAMRWDGAAWSQLGGDLGIAVPFAPSVRALALAPNGEVVLAGAFSTIGGISHNSIATWNGSSWAPLGSGITSGASWGTVYDLQRAGSDLVAVGSFNFAGGVSCVGVAAWDGASWRSLGNAGLSPNEVELGAGGELLVASNFLLGGRIAAFDGTTWTTLLDVPCERLIVLPDGRPAALVNYPGYQVLSAYDGSAWTSMTSGFLAGGAFALARLPAGLLVSGSPIVRGGVPLPRHLALVDDQGGVTTFAGGANGTARAAVTLPGGDLVIGGSFSEVGGVAAIGLARFDGQQWHAFGDISGGASQVRCLLPVGNQLFVGGTFTAVGGVAATAVARWDGTSWSPLGVSPTTVVHSLAALPNGDIVLATSSTPAVWRFDGTSWSPLGSLAGPVVAICVDQAGQVVAGGDRVRRFVGNTWVEVGTNSPVRAGRLLELPNGDLVADDENDGRRLWRGSAAGWSRLGPASSVLAAVLDPAGGIYVTARFEDVGGSGSGPLGRYAAPCPATTSSWGVGCVGGSTTAPVQLQSRSLPWVGTTHRSVAAGLPANALAVVVLGFQTASSPLSGLGGNGCVLRVQPDALALVPVVAGEATAHLLVPNLASLVGLVLHQQVLPVELSATGDLVAVLASNRLSLTLGSF